MHALWQLILQHPVIAMIVAFAIVNASVQAMEKPTEKNGAGYRYLYRFGHLVAFNFQYAARSKFPEYVPEIAEKPVP
jgi:hypothetical protein